MQEILWGSSSTKELQNSRHVSLYQVNPAMVQWADASKKKSEPSLGQIVNADTLCTVFESFQVLARLARNYLWENSKIFCFVENQRFFFAMLWKILSELYFVRILDEMRIRSWCRRCVWRRCQPLNMRHRMGDPTPRLGLKPTKSKTFFLGWDTNQKELVDLFRFEITCHLHVSDLNVSQK